MSRHIVLTVCSGYLLPTGHPLFDVFATVLLSTRVSQMSKCIVLYSVIMSQAVEAQSIAGLDQHSFLATSMSTKTDQDGCTDMFVVDDGQ